VAPSARQGGLDDGYDISLCRQSQDLSAGRLGNCHERARACWLGSLCVFTPPAGERDAKIGIIFIRFVAGEQWCVITVCARGRLMTTSTLAMHICMEVCVYEHVV
jgi:hypothetical protein